MGFCNRHILKDTLADLLFQLHPQEIIIELPSEIFCESTTIEIRLQNMFIKYSLNNIQLYYK